jgi:hypothetical protein
MRQLQLHDVPVAEVERILAIARQYRASHPTVLQTRRGDGDRESASTILLHVPNDALGAFLADMRRQAGDPSFTFQPVGAIPIDPPLSQIQQQVRDVSSLSTLELVLSSLQGIDSVQDLDSSRRPPALRAASCLALVRCARTMLPSSSRGTAVAGPPPRHAFRPQVPGLSGGGAMSPESFAERVLRLERQMDEQRHLPEAVTELSTQFAQFRSYVRAEFSALRQEMADGFAAVRSEMAEGLAALRSEMVAGDEETRRFMRVLHEDLVGRIALLQEGLNGRKRKPRRGSGSSG